MTILWQSSYASLDNCLARLSKNIEELRAAKPVDVAEIVEGFAQAADAAQSLRSAISAALPGASWRTREELDALLAQVKTISDARSRLLALATELEQGDIVHRRALRVAHLNHLRAEAVQELRSQAEAEAVPPTLPGPESHQWVEWACGLKEPDDVESIEALRRGFADVDNFVANLEPGMWVVHTKIVS